MNRLIQWFVENPIAANLLMVVILTLGFINITNLNKEVFPGVETGRVKIVLPYPGAGPAEVEEQTVKRAEEAIADLEGIKSIESTSQMSRGTVLIEAISGYDTQKLLNNIKTRIDAISTFPVDAERPQISDVLYQSQIMSIGIFGDVDERTLKTTGERLRDEIALLPGISNVELVADRADEMSIEILETSLRRYNLRFEQVANAIRASSINLPAGIIKTDSGDVQLQTRGQAYSASDFENIVIDSKADGSELRVKDVATVKDGFQESNFYSRLNRLPAVFLRVTSSSQPDILESAAVIKDYLAEINGYLPPGVEAIIWQDWSHLFKGRLNLLLKNSITGLILVFIILMLFLRPLLALWVSVGIGIAFTGALAALPLLGVSLNMISMFAFLMVLGIVVDDAIIVGESIYSRQQHGLQGAAAAASGTKTVAKPVFFAVVSTMIFFVPILTVQGSMGDIVYAIPVVVILALFFSLVESLFILPAHLAHMKPENPAATIKPLRQLEVLREKLAHKLETFANDVYMPALERLLHHKGTTTIGFFLAFALSVAIFSGGWIQRSFMPVVPSDFVQLKITMPEGSSTKEMIQIIKRAEQPVYKMQSDTKLTHNENVIKNVVAWIYGNSVNVSLSLAAGEDRDISAEDISNQWRAMLGEIPEAEKLTFSSTINEMSEDVNLRLSIPGNDVDSLNQIAQQVISELNRYPGVFNSRTSLNAPRTEIEINLKPHAETLGVSLLDIARQLRQGFYGEEVQRIPRGSEDVKVMVRYSRQERGQIDQLSDMRIRTGDQRELPLEAVADISFVPGYSTIERVDRKRSILVSAEVEENTSVPADIVEKILEFNLPLWQKQYPGLELKIDGDMDDESEFSKSALRDFIIALLAIYCMMAVAFKSYSQPLLILTAIPFGFMGSIIGHIIMGREISMLSMLGFFACAGVVVNDNLVLLDRINQLRKQGMEPLPAALQAGRDRFRAIILTSVTTFIGLMPIMAETSLQALFLIPMVISLSFGVLFATTVTLVLVPTLYVLGNQLGDKFKNYQSSTHKQ
jgi:multidrug efflux pump subunit AcrB